MLDKVRALPSFAAAERVSVYVNMPRGELATWDLCRLVLQLGKALYIPRFSTLSAGSHASQAHRFTEMTMLRVRSLDELEHGLTHNKWGIAEPTLSLPDGSPRENALDVATGGRGLDLIVLPGVAFDTRGGRLGHGKGYYDRYIRSANMFATEHQVAPPVLLAVALREQVLDEVPCDPLDQPYDTLVTADGMWP